ncbi:MAG: hypothetical protein RIT27_1989 [Pseudomonadota bacterium]|jgi:cytochrome oxidase Cu insertion factor (SCO1/SenC/PrrC family)
MKEETYQKMIGIALIIVSVSWFAVLPFIPLKSNQIMTANLFTKARYALVFFGYPGCRDICAPTLLNLQKIYESCANPQQLAIIFVNLWTEMSEIETQHYAKLFHKDFIGLPFSSNLAQTFGAWKVSQPNGELIHSDYIYLVENQQQNRWILKEVFKEINHVTPLLSQLQCFEHRV